MTTRSLRCVVSGKVQGVYFRAWIHDQAVSLGLKGWVRNIADGRVETLAQGPEDVLEEFRVRLRQGSPLSRVDGMECDWLDYDKAHTVFDIR